MEKQIIISDISGKFLKDFDTFGKMDPFVTFKIGTIIEKTQTIQGAGKQPSWKANISLKATNQTQIEITAYDQDVTENQFIGAAKLDIKTLTKSGGNHKITLFGQDQKSIGDISFKYQIKQQKIAQTVETKTTAAENKTTQKLQESAKQIEKNIKPVQAPKQASTKIFTNSIKISDIKAKFTKSFDTFGKMQNFITFKIGDERDKTQVVDNKEAQIKWTKAITLRYNDDKELKIKAYDEDLTQNQYMGKASLNLESLKNKHQINDVELVGQDSTPIGTISFKYQIIEPKKPEPVQIKKQISQPIVKPIETKPVEQKPVELKPVAEQKKPIVQPKPIEKPKPAEMKPVVEAKPVVQQKLIDLKPFEKPKTIEPKTDQRVKTIQTQKQQSSKEPKVNENQLSINKSRSKQTLRLPNIGDVSRNYGDKIYDKQSSATLQKSILVYSMPKAQRFNSGPKYSGEPSYYVDSCFRPGSTKGVGFGFGSKRQFPQWMQKNMKQNPAPGSYFEQPKIAVMRTKGPTFGISYKFYEKVTIPKQKSPERVTKSNQRLKPILRTN